ncbi:metallophosphoesterase family protein [Eupransor demetentiae]|uniref:DNA repair exonuclease SbcCD nuclease subunit (SbcD) n=1 Tax=Eupransor demetentiae TaxID=3109584 RepID=A0ABM9N3M4_9LACO|nr:DNA repair exonuclease SbcCD nuclease subunit (SbcD) [Lactobacillaceae bacterium LMG 33000]
MLKFIHAGDVHLGNPFTGLDQDLPQQYQGEVARATFTAFENLIDYALEQEVDFVLFPGDFLHSKGAGLAIQLEAQYQLERLNQAGIPVYLSFGNHDFRVDQNLQIDWPANVHLFAEAVQTYTLTTRAGQRIALTGFSYQDFQQKHSLVNDFPYRDASFDYQIGLYHGKIGAEGDAYAPFHLDDLLNKNYDYWALGHIHQRQILHQKPYIAYSGNLQGLNRKEIGPKGAYLVQEEDDVLVSHFKSLAPVLWEEYAWQDVNSTLDLNQKLSQLQPQKLTLVSIDLSGIDDVNFLNGIQNGLVLEQIRAHALPMLWPVHLTGQGKQQQATNLKINADEKALWQQSLTEVLTSEKIEAFLSDEVPIEVKNYLHSQEGKADLAAAMWQLLGEDDGHEN